MFLLSWGRSPKLREFYAVPSEKGLCRGALSPFGRLFWQFFKLDADNPPNSHKKSRKTVKSCGLIWCPGPESNRHALRRRILSPLRLPIPPPGQNYAWRKLWHRGWSRGRDVVWLCATLQILPSIVFGGLGSRWMHGRPYQKPALLPGFRSLFLDFETKLCFWSRGIEANRFFTAGTGKRRDRPIRCVYPPNSGHPDADLKAGNNPPPA